METVARTPSVGRHRQTDLDATDVLVGPARPRLDDVEDAREDDPEPPTELVRVTGQDPQDEVAGPDDLEDVSDVEQTAQVDAVEDPAFDDGPYPEGTLEAEGSEDDRFEDDRFEDDRFEDERFEDERFEDERFEDAREDSAVEVADGSEVEPDEAVAAPPPVAAARRGPRPRRRRRVVALVALVVVLGLLVGVGVALVQGRDADPAASAPAQATVQPAAFGETVDASNGWQVQFDEPNALRLDAATELPGDAERVVRLEITLTNMGAAARDSGDWTVKATADGRPAELYLDESRGLQGVPSRTVIPGGRLSFPVAVALPSGDVELQMEAIATGTQPIVIVGEA